MITFQLDPAGLRAARAQRNRLALWLAQYDLVESRVYTGGSHCVLPLLGRRCRFNRRWWEKCPGCIPSSIGDHGRYYRRRGERRPLLFLGQPYNQLGTDEQALLDQVRAMGLFAHVGDYGHGWYNTGTLPIVISREPIPEHHYRCEPYTDDLAEPRAAA